MASINDTSCTISRIFRVKSGQIKVQNIFEELVFNKIPFHKTQWFVECSNLIYDGSYHFFHPSDLVVLVSPQLTLTNYMGRQIDSKMNVILSGHINNDGHVIFHGGKPLPISRFTNHMEFYVAVVKWDDDKFEQEDSQIFQILKKFDGLAHLTFTRI